jgi:hypothetical protein
MARKLGPDRERLILFLQQTERLLGSLVTQVATGSRVSTQMSVRVAAAWREVKGRIASTKYWVQRAPEALDRLRHAGLAGPQLELSYQRFIEAHAEYTASGKAARVLHSMDAILVGLAALVPDAAAVLGFEMTVEGMLG